MSQAAAINIALRMVDRATVPMNRAMSSMERSARSTERRMQALAAGTRLVSTALAGVVATLGLRRVWQDSIRDWSQAERQLLRIERQIANTGAASWTSADQINDFARTMGRETLAAAADVQDAASVMLSFRQVTGDTFFEAIQLAQDMASVYGTDLRSATMQLAKALEDPVQGLTALRRSGTIFSASQQGVIKSLVETGQQADAMRVILDEVARQVGGAAKAEAQGLAGALDLIKESAYDVRLAIGEGLAPTVHAFATSFSSWLQENPTAIKAWTNTFLDGLERVQAETLRTGMLLDKIGGSMTFVASLPSGIPAALGIKSSQDRMQRLADLNIMYEQRFWEKDQMLEDLARRQIDRQTGQGAWAPRPAMPPGTGIPSIMDPGPAVDPEHDRYLERLLQRLLPLEHETREYNQALAALNAEHEAGRLIGERYDAALRSLEESTSWYRSATEAAAQVERERVAELQRLADVSFAVADAQYEAGLMVERLTLEALPAQQRAVALVEQQYQSWFAQVEQLRIIGEISNEQADAFHAAFAVRMVEDLDALAGKGYDTANELALAMSGWASGFSATLTDAVMGAEASFQRILDSFTRMLMQMIIQKKLVDPMFNFMMGSGPATSLGGWLFPQAHSGWRVGMEPPPALRAVDPAIFTGAPRLHNGLRPDEFPAILQRGEEVVPRWKAKRPGGEGLSISVPVTVESNKRLAVELQRRIESVVMDVVRRHS